MSEQPGPIEPGSEPEHTASPVPIRASDADREQVLRALTEHASVGRLTLVEHEERAGNALTATYRDELASLLADLPTATAPGPEPRRRSASRWVVSVLGDTKRTGRWRLGERLNVLGIMGDSDLDLRGAELDEGEAVIGVVNVMGDTNIYVPDSVEVEVVGLCLLGDRREYGAERPLRPGAPRVTVRVFALMGDCSIYRLADDFRDVPGRKAAKELRRAQR